MLQREFLKTFNVLSPNSWEEADQLIRENPDAFVITDGDLWGTRSAHDVYHALYEENRSEHAINDRVVLYSGNVKEFPEFKHSVEKPDIAKLVQLLRELFV